MKVRNTVSLAELASTVGKPGACSDWILVDQALIDRFADVSGDDAFIHVDPVRAAGTRFHGTIAHGLLTLSLLPFLMRSATPLIENLRMGVNYGFDRVRFLEPVPVGARVRARFDLVELIEPKPRFYRVAYDVVVEIEGNGRPALSARWLLGRWLGDGSLETTSESNPG
jgi:acyl dehydratase